MLKVSDMFYCLTPQIGPTINKHCTITPLRAELAPWGGQTCPKAGQVRTPWPDHFKRLTNNNNLFMWQHLQYSWLTEQWSQPWDQDRAYTAGLKKWPGWKYVNTATSHSQSKEATVSLWLIHSPASIQQRSYYCSQFSRISLPIGFYIRCVRLVWWGVQLRSRS